MTSIKLTIDDREVSGFQGQTILDVARAHGIEIPTLCHDDRVERYGSCGLCLVEAEGNPKLLRSCSTMAADGMKIHTSSDRILKNRKAALELLLSDHTGDCRPPCVLACPGKTDCQGYVGLIANGAYDEAYRLIKDVIPLPGSIGRVCPHPCEEACRRSLVEEPISIASLKQFAADAQSARGEIYTAEVAPKTGKRVAVIGGGPGGLTAAYFLASQGHEVTVYDAMPCMGGMLRYGIPEYRLPKKVLQEEIDAIASMGVQMRNNVRVGQDITLDELRKGNDAVVIAIGAWSSTGMGCPGEALDGVHGGIEFLWNITGITSKLLRRRVAIVGGGNTAMDACRTAVRSGASVVYNIYRRTRNEMPAEETEIDEAEEEGVIFKNLTNPIEIVGEGGKVKAMRLQIMELGEPDASGRRKPVPVPGLEEVIEVDTVIMAIGQKPNTAGFDGVSQSKWSTIIADEHTFRTNMEGVFAVGDATNNGADIAITAIGEAQRAAQMVHKYLCGEALGYEEPFLVKSEKTADDLRHVEKRARVRMPHRSASDRKKDFNEINYGFSEEQAREEAARCLECGCMDFFECKLVEYAGAYQVKPEKYSGRVHHRVHEDDHPYIRRNPDKCILCGLCVRICEQVVGASAIGFMQRGFDTVVMPAFDANLKDTACISCGQCVHVCPTGALTETMMVGKQVPLKERVTESVCAGCSIGCKTRVTSSGSLLLRSLPGDAPDALLCQKGRFGFGDIAKAERVTRPLMRIGNGLEEVSFERAIAHVNDSLRGLQARHGGDCVAVAVSGRCTNEEAALIKAYAEKALKTKNVFSAGVLGGDASTAGMEDLEIADLVVAVQPQSAINRSVAAMRIHRAVNNGAKLVLITPPSGAEDSLLPGIASLQIDAPIGQALKDARLAALIQGAKKPVFIFEKSAVDAKDAKLAAKSGGVVQLLPDPNSQGLTNLGVRPGEALRRAVSEGKIRGLLLFGEKIDGLDLSAVEFLLVQDLHMTEAARQADVVLPASSFAETDGSFTGFDNQTRALKQAVKSPVAWDNIAQIKALAASACAPVNR